MTELKEKITYPFPFFKISTSPLASHCQAAQADTQTKAWQIAAILPSHLKVLI